MNTKVQKIMVLGIDLRKAKNGVSPTPVPTNTHVCLKIAD